MLIKDLFESVSGLPKQINVIDDGGKHIWIGDIDKTPEEIKMLNFDKAFVKNWDENQQVIFYI